MKKFIKITTRYFALLIILVTISGCSKESPKKDYIARVNNSYLTREDLNKIVDSDKKTLYKNEIVRNWINKELLYQIALKEDITEDKEFNRILDNSKKELAITIYLERLYEKEKLKPSESDIEEYYKQNKNDYRLFQDAYVFNKIDFNSEDQAIKFRSLLLGSNWNKTINGYKNDQSVLDIKSDQLSYEYELQPGALIRIIKELNPDEISIVFGDSSNVYTVVQLVQKFAKGSVPPFAFIKDLVRKRLEAQRKEEFLKNYIKELYSKNDIEVITK